jgi:prostaglandin-H2 D-isomerase / glutathione transferase
MSNIRLSYFDGPGRAEPIRIALRISGIPFEDHRFKFPEFAQLRAEGAFPLGSVPVMEVDGQRYVQTAAILRYVARIGDSSLYPSDPTAALRVDSALDSFNDTLSAALVPSMFERDPQKKLAMRAELAAGPMARVFTYVESLIAASGGPFVGGSSISIADLVIAAQILQIRSGHLDGLSTETLAPYTRLNALADAYLADPRIVALAKK